jgi:hypothetical protein
MVGQVGRCGKKGWQRRSGHCAAIVLGTVGLMIVACSASEAGEPGARVAGGARWRPPTRRVAWQWELDHPLNVRSKADLGTSSKTYLGRRAARPVVYDIDGFDNPASTVRALHRLRAHVICYIEVGAAENYRPDYRRFPKSVLGRRVPGYPSERYLDIRKAVVARIIKTRIAMCARKGFDAIEPDIDDSYTDQTGFRITEAANVGYDAALASFAHSLGLAWGLKNGDAPGFAARMLPHVDFALDEQCYQYGTCSAFYPRFARAHKAVLEVEYAGQGGPSPRRFCPPANRDGFDSVQFDVALDGKFRVACF